MLLLVGPVRFICAGYASRIDSIGLIGAIQDRLSGIGRKTTRTRAQDKLPPEASLAGLAIEFKDMNPPSIPRRQIDLCGQSVFQRRTKRPHVSQKWTLGFGRILCYTKHAISNQAACCKDRHTNTELPLFKIFA